MRFIHWQLQGLKLGLGVQSGCWLWRGFVNGVMSFMLRISWSIKKNDLSDFYAFATRGCPVVPFVRLILPFIVTILSRERLEQF